MSQKIRLLPGIPDDSNRDYLPDSLFGSSIVVNESGNNSIPFNPRLVKHQEDLTGTGKEDTWYEYIPSNYDGTQKVPLILSLHGGLMTGWAQAVYTGWTMVAEREGFICVFPEASFVKVWTVEKFFDGLDDENFVFPKVPDKMEDNHDMNMLLALIEKTKKNYAIDEGRIFMQGMSMGNLMTAQFSRFYGNLLAGAAGSACDTPGTALFDENGNLKNRGGHLAVWQSRPENNRVPYQTAEEESKANRFNRYYWMKLNEVDPIPEISIQGQYNFAFYKGKKADQVFLDIKNRDHGQTLDEAFLYWDYFFSGIHREPDGTIVCGESILPRTGDATAAAFVEGIKNIWWDNRVHTLTTEPVKWQKLKYHGLNGSQNVRGEYLMVPVSFLAEFAHASCSISEDTLTAVIAFPDGRELQFARGSIGCMIDNTMRCMYCEAIHRNGELLISLEWFAECILGYWVSECNGVTYVTDHAAELSYFMADLIRDILLDRADLSDYDRFMREDVPIR